MRRRSGNVSSNSSSPLPLTSPDSKDKRKGRRSSSTTKRDNGPVLIVAILCLGGFLIMHLFSRQAATDPFTIPGLSVFLRDAYPVASQQYAVFVTKANDKHTFTRLGRSKKSASDALKRATAKLPSKVARAPWIKVDVVVGTKTISSTDVTKELEHTPGWWFGIALQWDLEWAFSPDEVFAQVIVDGQNRLRFDRMGQYAKQRGLSKTWPLPEEMVDDTTSYEGFEYVLTNSLFCDFHQNPLKTVPLYHGHAMIDEIRPDLLLESSIAAGTFLTKCVNKDGSMIDSYFPRTGFISKDFSYSRSPIALYAMSVLYKEWKDDALLKAIHRGLEYLVKKVKPCAIPYQPTSKAKCFQEEDDALLYSYLGHTVLLLLAMTQYMDVTDDKTYFEMARDMAAFVVGSQNKTDGSFVEYVEFTPALDLDHDYHEDYTQGQATFALAKLYRVFKKLGLPRDEEWMISAAKSSEYALSKYVNTTDEDWDFNHWNLMGIAEMHPVQDQSLNGSQHALRAARIAHVRQIPEQNDRDIDRLGLFDNGLPITKTVRYSQGLCAVHSMFVDIGKKQEAEQVLDMVTLSARQQLQAQHRPETAMHFKDPNFIMGAFHYSLIETGIRNDYTSQNILSLLCLRQLLLK